MSNVCNLLTVKFNVSHITIRESDTESIEFHCSISIEKLSLPASVQVAIPVRIMD